MKLNVLLYFLIIPNFLLGQALQDSLNLIDSLGQKQGYWIEKDTKIKLVRFEINSSEIYLDEITEYRLFKMAEGNYLNDQKVGQWYFYPTCTSHFVHLKEIKLGTLPVGSKDTSMIVGEIYQNGDTLFFNCSNNNCIVKTLNNIEIVSFPQKTLDKELENFSRCRYWRLIRRKLNSR
jgi:hypothetical protein